jgi:phospholipid transport system substrate-binding protein
LLLASTLASGPVRAEGTAPDAMVRSVTQDVLTVLRQDKGIRSGNRQRAVAVIESKVAPHFDFARMTRLAVGRAWRQADDAQRTALTGEFRTLLVRTYASALTAFRDQTVTFSPPSAPSRDGEVTVHSQINKPGAQPIALDYTLAKSGDDWKVFDVAVADVSLVTTYRSTFAGEMEKGGVQGLIDSLKQKNRQGDANATSGHARGTSG